MDELSQRVKERQALRALVATGEARNLRLRSRLTLREGADAVGVRISTIWRWERGERFPRGDDVSRYLGLLRRLQRIA